MDSLCTFISSPSNCAILLVSAFTVFYAFRVLFKSRPHFPPGPDPLPFIGNVLQLPTEHPEIHFLEWAHKYGDIVHIRVFGQPMVILNSIQVARDLMDRRSSIYSDRPRFVLFSELMGWHTASTHMRYGARFRKHRRFIQRVFNQRAVPALRPLQEQETLTLINSLIQTPEHFIQHFRRYAASSIMKITYGHTITSVDDPLVQLAEQATTLTVESGTPAATLVDFFPFMKHLPTWAPFSTFKRKALFTREAVDKMMNIPYEIVKNDMKAGSAIPSFTSTLLESCRLPGKEYVTPEDEADIKGAAGTLYAASQDTTVSVLEAFFLAMTRHSEVYAKVQAEIDSVTRGERLPDFEDRPSLPYLECVLQEVYRWCPPIPLGLPHRLMEDDVYHGYLVPEGSTVIANIYAMTRDCPDPETFQPERYMENSNMVDPRTMIFGFGRRICPGRHYAEAGLWFTLSRIIATLDISQVVDESGNRIVPEANFTTAFVCHPKPFPCKITPRKKSIRLLQAVSAVL